MSVDIANASPHQSMPLDEEKNLGIGCRRRLGQSRQQRQYFSSVSEVSASQLADNEEVGQYLVGIQQTGELVVPDSQKVDPDGRIDQYHAVPERRRGTGSRSV